MMPRKPKSQAMQRLKEHYGAVSWYELAEALARKVGHVTKDQIFRLKLEPTHPTAANWKSHHGQYLLADIDAMKADYQANGKPYTIMALLREHQDDCDRCRHMKLENLERRYYETKAYWDEKLAGTIGGAVMLSCGPAKRRRKNGTLASH